MQIRTVTAISYYNWINILNIMQMPRYFWVFQKTSRLFLLSCGLLCGSASGALSDPVAALPLTQVSASVYVATGDTGPPTYENGGHNNNLSVIVTTAGVVVVNGGDSYQLAARLHQSIRQITPVPVVWLINENGQGHAVLGNSYWRDQGVKIIAHRLAAAAVRQQATKMLSSMRQRNLDKADGTYVAIPDLEFEQRMQLNLGDRSIHLINFGEAHSPGDISVWLPDEKTLITGDIAFHQRLLAIFPDTNVAAWIDSFQRMSELQPLVLIPGHGAPTDIETVRTYTQGYLQYLTAQVQEILDAGGGLAQAYGIDQSDYAHLNTFEELAVKNAGRLFQTLEMESF